MNKPVNEVPSTAGLSAREQLELLQLEEYKARREKELDEKRQFEAFREAQLNNVRKSMEEKALQQAACPHMKPNFRPNIGGQKDHRGNFHFICQACSKEWGNDIPVHLRISGDQVGGPQ